MPKRKADETFTTTKKTTVVTTSTTATEHSQLKKSKKIGSQSAFTEKIQSVQHSAFSSEVGMKSKKGQGVPAMSFASISPMEMVIQPGPSNTSRKAPSKISTVKAISHFGDSLSSSNFAIAPSLAKAPSAKSKKSVVGKSIWLVYHKIGRQDARLMGVYTSPKGALKNATAIMDKETGCAWRQMPQLFEDIKDYSSNIRSEEGVIFEVKQREGVKIVVSFKQMRLNENLSGMREEEEEEDDDDDA